MIIASPSQCYLFTLRILAPTRKTEREKAGPIYLCFAPYWTDYPSGPVNLIDHEEIATKAQLLDHWEVDTIPFEGLFKTI